MEWGRGGEVGKGSGFHLWIISFFLSLFIQVISTAAWGSNLQTQDQESLALQSKPARCPWIIVIILMVYYYLLP